MRAVKKLFILFIFLVPSISFAAPSITSTAGTFNDGGTYSIIDAGSGFGSKSPADPESWLGGVGGNIESGSGEFSASNWSIFASGGSDTPQYSSTRKHSYSKSISHRFYDAQYDNGIRYNYANLNEAYLTAWMYIDQINTPATSYQLKIGRTTVTSAHDVANDNSDCGVQSTSAYLTWKGGAGGQTTLTKSGCTATGGVYWDNDLGSSYWGPEFIEQIRGRWKRVNLYWKRNTGQGNTDGVMWVNVYGGKAFSVNYNGDFYNDNIATHASGDDDNWNYLFFTSFLGNYTGAEPKNIIVYNDDIYLDTTQARVELCNFSSWSNRYDVGSACEIQPATSWAAGSITIEPNFGGTFSTGQTGFLYVIDSDGAVSNSEAVTIGSSEEPTDTSPPYTSNYSPIDGGTGVATDSDVSFHIYDQDGQNLSTAHANLSFSIGTPTGTTLYCDSTNVTCTKYDGQDFHYLVTKTGNTFSNNTQYTVNINAADTQGNTMTQQSFSFTTVVTSAATIAITVPASDGNYEAQISPVTISGTSSGNTAVTYSCPTCTVTSGDGGYTDDAFSFSLAIPTTGYGANQLLNGTFDSDLGYWDDSNWTIGGGVVTASGASTGGKGLWQDISVLNGTQRRICYEVTAKTDSGDDISLVLSRWSYISGTGQTVSSTVGTHCVDVTVLDYTAPFGIVYVNPTDTGSDTISLDNITDQLKGPATTVTVTGNGTGTPSDSIVITYNAIEANVVISDVTIFNAFCFSGKTNVTEPSDPNPPTPTEPNEYFYASGLDSSSFTNTASWAPGNGYQGDVIAITSGGTLRKVGTKTNASYATDVYGAIFVNNSGGTWQFSQCFTWTDSFVTNTWSDYTLSTPITVDDNEQVLVQLIPAAAMSFRRAGSSGGVGDRSTDLNGTTLCAETPTYTPPDSDRYEAPVRVFVGDAD